MNEYILGNIFGLSQIIIGYPFDTIKTYIQNSKSIKPLIQSPKLFYKGVKYPLFTNMISATLLFGNYSYFLQISDNKFISASATGVIGAFFITPFDYFKIQRQIQENNYEKFQIQNKYLINNIKKIYSGLLLTILRESIAIPVYFLTFDYMYYQSNINSFLSGGVAGINSWFFTYPLDTLKTRRQLYPLKSLSEIIAIGSLYNGLSITLLRGFIVNGSCFYFYSVFKPLKI